MVRGLVKRPGKAGPNRLSNSTLEFHQTTYHKPYPIETERGRERDGSHQVAKKAKAAKKPTVVDLVVDDKNSGAE